MLGMALTRIFGTCKSKSLLCLLPASESTYIEYHDVDYGTTVTAAHESSPSRPTATIMRRVDALCPGSMDTMWRATVNGPIRYNALLSIVERRGDRFAMIVRVVIAKTQPEYLVLRSPDQLDAFIHSLESTDPKDVLQLPSPPFVDVDTVSIPVLQQYLRAVIIALSAPPPPSLRTAILDTARTLLEGFLLGTPERIGSTELDNLFAQAARDDEVLDKENEAWIKAGKRAKVLRSTYSGYKQGLIHGTELENSFGLLRKCSTTKELAVQYQDAEKWAQIFVAYALQFVPFSLPSIRGIGLIMMSSQLSVRISSDGKSDLERL